MDHLLELFHPTQIHANPMHIAKYTPSYKYQPALFEEHGKSSLKGKEKKSVFANWGTLTGVGAASELAQLAGSLCFTFLKEYPCLRE